MREIKFRGKSIVTGEWVYGCLTLKTGSPRIAFYNKGGYWVEIEVIPDTIGQCVGMKDKHGIVIFEGDILNYSPVETTYFNLYEGQNDEIQTVVFEEGCFMGKDKTGYVHFIDIEKVEKIGNIHENAKLLEVVE